MPQDPAVLRARGTGSGLISTCCIYKMSSGVLGELAKGRTSPLRLALEREPVGLFNGEWRTKWVPEKLRCHDITTNEVNVR